MPLGPSTPFTRRPHKGTSPLPRQVQRILQLARSTLRKFAKVRQATFRSQRYACAVDDEIFNDEYLQKGVAYVRAQHEPPNERSMSSAACEYVYTQVLGFKLNRTLKSGNDLIQKFRCMQLRPFHAYLYDSFKHDFRTQAEQRENSNSGTSLFLSRNRGNW
jgi:hypothetical protein